MIKRYRIISLLLSVVMLVCSFSAPLSATAASKTTPSTVYNQVKKAYGKSFPLTKKATKVSCSEVGVSKKDCVSYYGMQEGSNTKYMVFIAKAKDKNSIKKIKEALNNYVKTESRSMANYLTAQGKKLYKNAKVGSNGSYVYLVIVDTGANKKAVNAIKKAAK